ncbi:MAG: acetolactate synthase small subunit [Chloroflexi bacterium]|nr:acetolactate synthase small subunit [Chloroflexota bacterium]
MKHTITALVSDKPAVLSRVSSLFRRRGFNITSLAVGNCEIPGMSRMAFVVEGDDGIVEQITKQLRTLIDVIKVSDISKADFVSRELALIRVRANSTNRSEIIQLVDIFRANIVDVAPESLIIEVTGDEDKIESINDLLKTFGVTEMIRTGTVAMMRGMAGGTEETQATNLPRSRSDATS